jgi:class 3 adenylate cyclase/pimeloyl-ACP methyl ester carboxylesterase
MPLETAPETRFAGVGNDRVAYQTIGDGPRDLVHTLGLWSQVDVILDDPSTQRYLRRLASTHRVILFDARGTGRSDERPADGRSIAEHWSEDLLAVLDAAGSRAPAMLGIIDAGPLMLRFLELHPERCSRLVLFNTSACFSQAPDYPIGFTPKQLARFFAFLHVNWGQNEWSRWFVPSVMANEPLQRFVARWCRAQASPGSAVANVREIVEMDGRAGLGAIAIPTLVMSRQSYAMIPPEHGRYIADHIPGARFALLPGGDGLPMFETSEAILDQIEEFLTGSRHGEPERVLATVLFTDIADSTRRAAELGDVAWRQLLDRHDRALRQQIGLHRGSLVDSAGDGALATFERPDHAIECALALHRALDPLGIRIRTGLHTGTLELREDGRVGGMAVHIGARVAAESRPGEVLVSRTLRDVLLGSRYAFRERGEYELKGVPDRWPLYLASRGEG